MNNCKEMPNSALITGILGQDGIYLTKFLYLKNYSIYGMVRNLDRNIVRNFEAQFPKVKLLKGDLSSASDVQKVIESTRPTEIYNLGGVSSVYKSFNNPELFVNINGLGVLRILEAIKNLEFEKITKIFQASSSEIFGNSNDKPQNENSLINPITPYGFAKAFAHQISNYYRKNFGIFVACGITYNHESELRGEEFVTRKITSNLAKIKLKKLNKFSLGDLNSKRDWGYAGDYVKAMWLMLQQENPEDFIISTGVQHSVMEFVECSMREIGLYGKISDYIDIEDFNFRKTDTSNLVGDNSKARNVLGWKPSYSFQDLVRVMARHDLDLEMRKGHD